MTVAATAVRAGVSRSATAASLVGMGHTSGARSAPGAPRAPRRTKGVSGASIAGGSKYVKILKAEWLLCIVILALSPLADPDGEEGIGTAFKRCAACTGVFFLLGLVAAGGPRPARGAAGFGGLITVALCLSSRDVFGTIAERIQNGFKGDGPAVLGGVGDDTLGMPDVSGASSGTGPDGVPLSGNDPGAGLGPGGNTIGQGGTGGLGPGGTPL
jgi:hypothetical protein